jgi:DNA invertase Pin-like site-specific DNA recombinase
MEIGGCCALRSMKMRRMWGRLQPQAVDRDGDLITGSVIDIHKWDWQQLDEGLTRRSMRLSLAARSTPGLHPTDPVGRLHVRSMVAEFETDLISLRTREAMAVARPLGPRRASRVRDPATATR